MERISGLNDEIERLDHQKLEMQETFEQEKKVLEKKLKSRYDRRDELNQQVKDMTGEIARMNVTRNYLHQSISDLEKVLVDLEHEQIRLMAKRDTVMAELAEKSY